MDENAHIVALCGSLADDSGTRKALSGVVEAASEAGATAELVDLREFQLSRYDSDARETDDAERLVRLVDDADGVVLGTPMYHGSYSSVIKNALDYCSIEHFENKPVGLLAVSGGQFPTEALSHLRSVCRALNTWTIPHEVAIPNSYKQFEDGRLVDEDLRDRVSKLGRDVVHYSEEAVEPEA